MNTLDKIAGNWSEVGDCWVWKGSLKPDGYGRVRYQGKTHMAHRLVFLREHGYLPPEVHHRCEVRGCINPEHLQATEHREHMQLHKIKDECSRGHDMTDPSNFTVYSWGRMCKQCNRIKALERYHSQTPEQRAKVNARRRELRMERKRDT